MAGHIKDNVVYNDRTRSISSITFRIKTNDEYKRQSVAEITKPNIPNVPTEGTIRDPRLGCLTHNNVNTLTGQKHALDPGFFGTLPLVAPIIRHVCIPYVLQIMKITCPNCSSLMFDNHKRLRRMPVESRIKHVIAHTTKACPVCGAPKLLYSYSADKRIMIEGRSPSDKAQKQPPVLFTRDQIYTIFQNITIPTQKLLGLATHPTNMLWTAFPIAPTTLRAAILQDNNTVSDDTLTHLYVNVIKTQARLRADLLDPTTQPSVIQDHADSVQYIASVIVDNSGKGGMPISKTEKNKHEHITLVKRTTGKEGLIRGNLNAKRVDSTARSVIIGDPTLSVGELGVPIEIAMNITYPEIVNQFNIDKLRAMIINGAYIHPGANKISYTTYRNGTKMRIVKNIGYCNEQQRKDIRLEFGQIVHRHLVDGDDVLFNRQPSLHKMSTMNHRVVICKTGSAFRMCVTAAAPYNADFDGDEMNMHVPLSHATRIECGAIMAVSQMMITPQSSSPVIGLVQDTIVGWFDASRERSPLDYNRFVSIISASRMKTLKLSLPNMSLIKQVLWNILPTDMIYSKPNTMDGAFVKNPGEISGILDANSTGKSPGGLIHSIWLDESPTAAIKFCDEMNRTAIEYIRVEGYTTGMRDMVIDPAIISANNQTFAVGNNAALEIIANFEAGNYIGEYTKLPFNMKNRTEHLERILMDTMQKTFTQIQDRTFKYIKARLRGMCPRDESYNMIDMVVSKSKGSATTLSQIMSSVGPQTIGGKRISYHLTDRPMFCHTKFTTAPVDRGYTNESYMHGLSVISYLFQQMATRDTIISRSIKTAVTGYMEHRMVKFAEDLRIMYDGTVRNAYNTLIQSAAAYNGVFLVPVKIKYMQSSDQAFAAKYGNDPHWDQLYADREFLKNLFAQRLIKSHSIMCPVNIPSEIARLTRLAHTNTKMASNDSWTTVYANINTISITPTKLFGEPASILYRCIVRSYLNPTDLNNIYEYDLFRLRDVILLKFLQATSDPGECVGVLAAQSIGEPTTQLALNEFKYAGIASKTNVTRGLPRVTEIINVSDNISSPSATISIVVDDINPERPETAYKRMLTARAMSIIGSIEQVKLSTILDGSIACICEPTPSPGLSGIIDLYKSMEIHGNYTTTNSWYLEITLNKSQFYRYKCEMSSICTKISAAIFSKYTTRPTILPSFLFSDKLQIFVIFDKITLPELYEIRTILTNTILSGIEGITKSSIYHYAEPYLADDGSLVSKQLVTDKSDVTCAKYNKSQRVSLSTVGSNLHSLLSSSDPLIDPMRTITNDIVEIYNLLGVEAARSAIIAELGEVFEDSGVTVNIAHIEIIADLMTNTGTILAVNRHGMARGEHSPLAKASFEMPMTRLVQSAMYGKVDNMNSVSSRIMFGQMFKGGTNSFSLKYDCRTLTETTHKQKLITYNASKNIFVLRKRIFVPF